MLHADLKARDSLALALMEGVRPDADARVLDALAGRAFARADFHETREGACRLMPPLVKLVAPVAEEIMRALAVRAAAGTTVPTPLTRANRCPGRDGTRKKLAERGKRREQKPDVALPPACLLCGVVDWGGRDYCDGCLPDYRAESGAVFAPTGPAALAAMRAEGTDPAHGGASGRKCGDRNAAHAAAVAAWERDGDRDGTGGVPPCDPDTFARDVLTGLRFVPLRAMAEATGLSMGYCSFVRRGLKVPHRRHWAVLRTLPEGSG